MSSSNFTGKTHRSLQSAFGPYTSDSFESGEPPGWWAAIICIAIVSLIIIWMTA